MLRGLARLIGGYALSRRDMRPLFAAAFLSFLGSSIAFPLWMLYAEQHHASPAQLGLMAGAFLLAPLLAQLPVGWLVDRWGRVPVLLIGLISHPLIWLLYIAFNAPSELIVLRFIEGIMLSTLQPSINAYIADVTPEEHRSEAYGVLGATLTSGLFIGPLIGGVVGQYFGFTAAFVASFCVEIAAVPLVLGRVHEPARHETHDRNISVPWSRFFSVPLAAAYVSLLQYQIMVGTLSALWAIRMHDLGGSYTYIGVTFTVFALPQIFLGAGAGRIADRLGRAPFLIVSGIIVGVIYISYGFVTSLVAIVVLGILEGVAIIFQQPLAQGLLADASPSEARGRTQGMAGTIGAAGGSLAAFVSPPLYHQSHALPFVLLGIVAMVASSIAAAGAWIFRRRRAVLLPALHPESEASDRSDQVARSV